MVKNPPAKAGDAALILGSTVLSKPPGLVLLFPRGVQGRISVSVNGTGASGRGAVTKD